MVIDQLVKLFTADAWWSNAAYIAVFYLVAWIIHRLAHHIARGVVRLSSREHQLRPERRETLRSMIANVVSFVAFTAATLVSLGRFVRLDTLVWVMGLFSAAFGLGARPFISDILIGISLIFDDTLAVGEKVEILEAEGVVEAVNLRTTWLRAPSGELYIVPNGEIRVVRNFSRGHFSTVKVTLKISADDLCHALPVIEELGQKAVALLPNLLEPWQVISETGAIGAQTQLTLITKARYGQAAEMRPRLLALLQDKLGQVGIELVD